MATTLEEWKAKAQELIAERDKHNRDIQRKLYPSLANITPEQKAAAARRVEQRGQS